MEDWKSLSVGLTEDVPARADDFESSFLKVIEQEGVVLSTPMGVKKKTKKFNQPTKKSSFLINKKTISSFEDAAEKLDFEAVACIVRRHEPPKSRPVTISFREHERSPFVVSLRDFSFHNEENVGERVPVAEQVEYSQSLALGKNNAYQAMASSALKSKVDPRLKKLQANQPVAASSALSLRLLGHRLKLATQGLFKKAEKEVEVLKEDEQAFVKEAEQEFTEAAEEVAEARFSYVKAGLGFLGLVVIITLPAQALVAYRNLSSEKDQVELQSQQAVAALANLSTSGDLKVSAEQLQDASGKFKEADKLLDESRLLAVSAAAVVPKQYKSAKSLLEVGDKMTQAGQLLAMGFGKVFDDPARGLIERLEVMSAYSRGVLPLLTQAESAAQKVDVESVPEAQRDQAKELPGKIGQARDSVREFSVLADALVGFLGKDRARTYLLVFQNQTELRPSGGFMGSVAEVTVDQGKLTSIYVPKGGTYDLKGQLIARVIPPKPLQLVQTLWQFQDANWFADFYKTAEKIRWFWSKSGQPTVDGVVAINASFMEKVLKVTGPVEMPEYGKTITADNFLLETQKAVEIEYDKEANTPKKFIGDLFDKMMAKAKDFTPDQWLALSSASSQALDTKEIQIAMFNTEEEALVERFGWQGRLKSAPGDELALVAANIAGQKTDAVVDESVKHVAEIQDDGSIIDTVRLTRTHNGQKGELFRGVRNVQYLRVYVPKGSELLDAQGFDTPPANLFKQPLETDAEDLEIAAIDKTAKPAAGSVQIAFEDDRTVFGGWLQLDPGKSQEVVLRYKLPFTVADVLQKVQESPGQNPESATRGAYLMLFTSQSGKNRQISQEVKLAGNWKSVWTRNPDGTGDVKQAADGKGLVWQGLLDRDQATAVLLTTNQDGHEQE
ncbi:MAG: DUF4012 domain-containing protein [Patescibacteria group bacterium]|nr:DUF4012 domain-containing protein [Patescibacteria group bacterium]